MIRDLSAAPAPLLFDSDAAGQGISAYNHTVHPERITVVDDPVRGPSRKVYRFKVHDTDTGPTSNPRAQLESQRVIRPGESVWIGWSTLFPADFPEKLPAGKWPFLTLAEVYGPPYAGAAPFRVAMRPDHPGLSVMSGFDLVSDIAPIRRGVWHDFALYQHMSQNSRVGYVELWLNTGEGWHMVAGRHQATVTPVNWSGDNYHKVASYRYPGMFDVVTLYHAEHRIGRGFSDVDPRSHV